MILASKSRNMHITPVAGTKVSSMVFVAVFAALFSACSAEPEEIPALAHAPWVLSETSTWDTASSPLGKITAALVTPERVAIGAAVAASDGELYVASDRGITLFEPRVPGPGVRMATAPHNSLAYVAAADGRGAWVTAITATGLVNRVTPRLGLQSVDARYSLDAPILSLVSPGDVPKEPAIAFLVGKAPQLAWSDGTRIRRYDFPVRQISAFGTRVAGVTADGKSVASLQVGNAASAQPGAEYAVVALPGALWTGFYQGTLFASTARTLLRQTVDGTFAVLFETAAGLREPSVGGDGIWFASGKDLWNAKAQCAPFELRPESRIAASPKSGVYVIDETRVRRIQVNATLPAEAQWRRDIEPIVARACRSCHAKGGTSGIQLDSFESWATHLEPLQRRVVERKTMPPAGPLEQDAMRKVQAWLSCKRDESKCTPR
jgi:hypothetical protein